VKATVELSMEPGIIDYVFVVGARNDDDGAKGWVNSTPDFGILKQFPSNDEFHMKNGRNTILPNKVEWFCFPDGCRLWRGLTLPNYDELRLKRFSASSTSQVATSFASFDACLACSTCFSWFVMASNSEEYGSEMVKTNGAVIRFVLTVFCYFSSHLFY
jgi:uDENN domain